MSTHLDPLLLHTGQVGPPQRGQTEEWTCPSLLPLQPCPPPSTSPPRPGLCPFARHFLCNSSLLTRSSRGLEGQIPRPSTSHHQAEKEDVNKKIRIKLAKFVIFFFFFKGKA